MTILEKPDERFQDFLRSFIVEAEHKYRKRLGHVALSGSKSLVVDFDDLIAFDPSLARSVLDKPDEYLEYLDRSAWAQLKIEDPEYAEIIKRIRIRFRKLPERQALRRIGSENIGRLLLIDGIIVRSTSVKPLLIRAAFQCRKCNAMSYVEQAGTLMRGPGVCAHCRSKIFEFLEKQSIFMNSQEIRIQERPEDLPPGQLPRAMDIKLSEDLVDIARPGDRVSITGIARAQQEFAGRKARLRTFELLLDANYVDIVGKEIEVVEITPEDERQIRELAKDPFIHRKLIASLAPSIYGYGDIKEAVLYLLFGGVPKRLPDGVMIRGETNVLLVGDPGCLVADERIVLGDGTIAKIGEMGQQHLQPLNTQILTGQGGAKRAHATRFHVYTNQPVLEIVTETGKSIKGTHNHPLLSITKVGKDLIREWKRLDEFKIGDRVAVVTGFPCTKKEYVDTEFHIQSRRLGPRFKGKLPEKVTPRLGALLGYMLGDGWAQRYRIGFTVSEPEKDLLPYLVSTTRDLFGLSPSISARVRRGRSVLLHEVCLRSEDIAANLAFLREKRVPDLILRSGNEVLSTFLKWLFEADGSVFEKGRGSRAISLKAKNIELLRDVQILLLRFGIHSRIIVNALLIRRGEDIIKFHKKIGFASKKKQGRLQKLASAAQDFKRFHGQRSERIIKIVRHEAEDVYDIEVPDGHRFIANGIISHNTAKSQLLQYVSRIAPRGLYTSGRGTTAAGLTAAVVREKSGGMVLEAGALVLADKGVACIDEMDKMRPEDRVAIHEALEQHSYHPLTEILLASGKKVKIGEFVDTLLRDHGSLKIIGKDCEILPANGRGISLITTPDFRTLTIAEIDRVSRHVAPDHFVEMTYSNGRRVLVTPEHPVFVYREGEIRTIPARELRVNDFAPGPRRLDPLLPTQQLVVPPVAHYNEKSIALPSAMSEDLGMILGYFTTEGYSYSGSAAELGFANTDNAIIDEMNSAVARTFHIVPIDYRTVNRTQRYISSRLYRYCSRNFPGLMNKAPRKRLPAQLMNASPDIVKAFLRSAFKGDGSVEPNALSLTTSSEGLAEDYQDLLLRLGIFSRITRSERAYKTYIAGDSQKRFVELVVDKSDRRYGKIMTLLKASRAQRGHDVVPTDACHRIIDAQHLLGLRNDGYFYKHLQRGDGITRHVFNRRIKLLEAKLAQVEQNIAEARSIRQLRECLGWSQEKAAEKLGSLRRIIDYAERGGYDESKRTSILNALKEYASTTVFQARNEIEKLEAIKHLRWLKIKNVRILPNEGRIRTQWVYDLTVEPTHNFVSHGAILHNTVSVAKGGIVATLNARAAVLAAANPSLGRYDPYRNITDNINLPVTLLSRFDLLFIMKDTPEPDSDSRMSDHILTLHRLKAPPEAPPMLPDLLRKYIAYAKRIEPILTEEAVNEIRQYYLKMRSLSGSTESPIAITPRQLEALVRLAEARARSFLRDKVEGEDAHAIIRLMTLSLQDVGIDTTTGKIDIDVIMTGKPKSLRDKMQVVLSTFADLEKQLGIVEEPTLYQALSRKVDITDEEARRLVEQLVREGILYAPKPGHLKRTAA